MGAYVRRWGVHQPVCVYPSRLPPSLLPADQLQPTRRDDLHRARPACFSNLAPPLRPDPLQQLAHAGVAGLAMPTRVGRHAEAMLPWMLTPPWASLASLACALQVILSLSLGIHLKQGARIRSVAASASSDTPADWLLRVRVQPTSGLITAWLLHHFAICMPWWTG